jgi:hypothetical protein
MRDDKSTASELVPIVREDRIAHVDSCSSIPISDYSSSHNSVGIEIAERNLPKTDPVKIDVRGTIAPRNGAVAESTIAPAPIPGNNCTSVSCDAAREVQAVLK